MNRFYAGINNFWVGLITGIMLPIMFIAALLYATVSKLTGLIEGVALTPLIQRSEQTFDKVDSLLLTLDDKVSNANFKELALLTPLKKAQILPELHTLAVSVEQLSQAVSKIDKEALIAQLKSKLAASLAEKFSQEKAQQLAQSLVDIALVLATRAESAAQASPSASTSTSTSTSTSPLAMPLATQSATVPPASSGEGA